VAARLPLARDDSSWARPYLEWAECACLFRPGARGDSLPSRAEWWRALAAATRLPFSAFPANDDTLREVLVLAGILPDSPPAALSTPLGWSEVVRDLDAARGLGWRLPPSPISEVLRRPSCARELGTGSPAEQPGELPRTAAKRPTSHPRIVSMSDSSRPVRPPWKRNGPAAGSPRKVR